MLVEAHRHPGRSAPIIQDGTIFKLRLISKLRDELNAPPPPHTHTHTHTEERKLYKS